MKSKLIVAVHTNDTVKDILATFDNTPEDLIKAKITTLDLFTKLEPTAVFIEVEDVETHLHSYVKLWEPPHYKEDFK